MRLKIENLEKELLKKDQEILQLKNQLKDQLVIFDNKEVLNILKDLKPKVMLEKEHLYKNVQKIDLTKKTLFDKYQESKFFNYMQYIKRIPILSDILIFIKHKILKWDI